jgi:hypothetical protein
MHEIAADISQFRLLLSALSRSHHFHPICAYHLAGVLSDRYVLLNQMDDLDNSILYLSESLLLSPHSWLAHGPMILDVLYFLAFSLCQRAVASHEPEDAFFFFFLKKPICIPEYMSKTKPSRN